MFKDFLGWLQDRLIRSGVVGLVEGVLGILGFGVLMSGLLGNLAIKSGLVVAAILVLLGALSITFADRFNARYRDQLERRLLVRYCTALKMCDCQQWRILHWNESAIVKSNGDSNERITLTAVVESETLDFFAIRSGPGWNQPARDRRRVKVGVSSFEGEGLDFSGWDVTSAWLNDGRVEVVVHFAAPMRHGALIKMTLDKEWPGKCVPLMKDHLPDEFALKFAFPIDRIKYSILLPLGFDAHCDAIGLREDIDDYELGIESIGTEQVEARLVAKGIPERQRVGMVLRLKGSRSLLRRVS